LSEGAGVKVIVSTVASNLKDCAPFASRYSSSLGTNQQMNWKQSYDEGIAAERAGDFPKAVSNYLAAARIDSAFADLHFRLGRSYLAVTNFLEARSHFELARDLDALPFRADTRLNQIIKATALKHAGTGVHFVDVVPALEQKSRQGIPGREFFFEHVHFNFEGNYLLARTIGDEVLPLLPDPIAKQNRGAWASAERCAQRLAVTDWDRRRVYDAVLRRLSEAPFVNQADHSEQMATLQKDLINIRARMTAEAVKSARSVYQDALAGDPDDFYLRGGFAKLQEDTGDLAGAATEWRRLSDLLPHEPAPYFFAGKLLARTGKADEAVDCFSRTLEIRPDFPDALDEKGQLLLKQRKASEALLLFEKVAKLQPGNARICLQMADAFAQLNRRSEALEKLREAVRLQPAYWEARYLLGVELALDGSIQQAAEQFSEVVQLNPNHALGHLNLAIAWAKLGKMNDAAKEFRETLRLDPNNKKAREYFQTVQELQNRDQR
jgi:tetratricopeptide (TPR) repeat protein